jgi:hypothetical protein
VTYAAIGLAVTIFCSLNGDLAPSEVNDEVTCAILKDVANPGGQENVHEVRSPRGQKCCCDQAALARQRYAEGLIDRQKQRGHTICFDGGFSIPANRS